MNKQIEEMARDIRIAETEYMVSMVMADIDDAIDGAAPINERLATALYAKGYRKSTDVAREIFEELEAIPKDQPSYVLYVFLIKKIAELKKKYESERTE